MLRLIGSLRLVVMACGVMANFLKAGAAAAGEHHDETEVPSIRTYFHVGGHYADDGEGRHILRDQMYVERLLPVHGATQPAPVVLVHGKGMTGNNFLNKPDGGRGWASDFISQGYEVYLVDQPFRGRSAWQPGLGQGRPSAFSAEDVEHRFTATRRRKLWSQADKHTQWPGRGVMGDGVFDRFYAATVQFSDNGTLTQEAMRSSGAALLDHIDMPVILVGHSQGGTFPLLVADARPRLAKALVLLEPSGPPFREVMFGDRAARAWGLSDVPLTYSPPVEDPARDLTRQSRPAPDKDHAMCIMQAEKPAPRRLANLVDMPILVVTSQSGYHAQYDYCTVQYLRQAGCSNTEHVELGEVGIHGNGHMMFLEKNSRQIQQVLHQWMQKL